MENDRQTPFENDLNEGFFYLKKSLSTLIQYTVATTTQLQFDQPALAYFQELEQKLYEIREKVNGLSLAFNRNLRAKTPYVAYVLNREIKNLGKLHEQSISHRKNEYTTLLADLGSELNDLVIELKRFNQP